MMVNIDRHRMSGTFGGCCLLLTAVAWLQVPEPVYRAEPYAPATAVLYTSNDSASASAIASTLFTPPVLTAAAVAAAASAEKAGLAQVLCTRHLCRVAAC